MFVDPLQPDRPSLRRFALISFLAAHGQQVEVPFGALPTARAVRPRASSACFLVICGRLVAPKSLTMLVEQVVRRSGVFLGIRILLVLLLVRYFAINASIARG